MPHYKDTNNNLHFLDSAEFVSVVRGRDSHAVGQAAGSVAAEPGASGNSRPAVLLTVL